MPFLEFSHEVCPEGGKEVLMVQLQQAAAGGLWCKNRLLQTIAAQIRPDFEFCAGI
jgi:hypothetical protein